MKVVHLCAVRDENSIICLADGSVVLVVLVEKGESDVVACADDDPVDVCDLGPGF